MPNFVSITCPSLQILGKNQTGYFRFPDFWSTLIKENCYNSRTSADIDMKLGPVTKIDKGNITTSKKLTLKSCRKIVTSFSLFYFWPIWSGPETGFRSTESAKVLFSVNVTFCRTKTENRTKKISNTALTLLL